MQLYKTPSIFYLHQDVMGTIIAIQILQALLSGPTRAMLTLPYMIIIALSRNSLIEKALEVEYFQYRTKVFHHKRGADDHDIPREIELDGNSNSIQGSFKKYKFEIRAYKSDNDSLKSINLISSEAEMLMELNKNNISVENLNSDTTYALRKIEYDFRILGLGSSKNNEKALQNMQYHIDKLNKTI